MVIFHCYVSSPGGIPSKEYPQKDTQHEEVQYETRGSKGGISYVEQRVI